jgi:hypothetical protein
MSELDEKLSKYRSSWKGLCHVTKAEKHLESGVCFPSVPEDHDLSLKQVFSFLTVTILVLGHNCTASYCEYAQDEDRLDISQ